MEIIVITKYVMVFDLSHIPCIRIYPNDGVASLLDMHNHIYHIPITIFVHKKRSSYNVTKAKKNSKYFYDLFNIKHSKVSSILSTKNVVNQCHPKYIIK